MGGQVVGPACPVRLCCCRAARLLPVQLRKQPTVHRANSSELCTIDADRSMHAALGRPASWRAAPLLHQNVLQHKITWSSDAAGCKRTKKSSQLLPPASCCTTVDLQVCAVMVSSIEACSHLLQRTPAAIACCHFTNARSNMGMQACKWLTTSRRAVPCRVALRRL